MPSTTRKGGRGAREGLSFWLVVLLVAAAIGLIAFRMGRDWLGKRLGEMNVAQGAPRIVAQAAPDPDAQAEAKVAENAPDKAVVAVEGREPTAGERRDIQQKAADGEPQDGAQLNAQQSQDAAGKAAGTDDSGDAGKAPGAHATAGKYVVTAGSFSNRANADRTMQRLESKGYRPYVETVTTGGRKMQRVNVAEVDSRQEADDLRQELSADGITARVSSSR